MKGLQEGAPIRATLAPRPSRPLKHAIKCSSSHRLPSGPTQLGVRDMQIKTPSPRPVPRALPELQLEAYKETTIPRPIAGTPPPSEEASTSSATPSLPSDLVVAAFRWPHQLSGRSVGVTGTFNKWGPPLPLTKVPGGDWVRSLAIPSGPIEFKYVVDGKYKCSPCENAAVTADGSAVNNHRLVQQTCTFSWPSAVLGGHDVFVAGDWSGWGELLPLSYDAVSGMHTLKCSLTPGTYAYQFLVDGEWKLLPESDAINTADGHFANVMKVEMPPAFRIYYSTGWKECVLKVRGLDAQGRPLTEEWTEIAMHDTASRGHLKAGGRKWKVAKIGAAGEGPPAALEFFPVNTESGAEDRCPGGGAYLCPRPGGFKLRSGKVRAFQRASLPKSMLVSDLDGTLVGDGPDADAKTFDFGMYWEDNAALVGSVLVYNTGRSLGQFQGLLESKGGALPVPDALITAVGTKIFLLDREGGTRGTASGLNWQEDLQWSDILDEFWDLEIVRAAGAAAIAASPEGSAHWLDDGSEHPHRIALSVRAEVVPAIKTNLKNAVKIHGIKVQIIVSGSGDWRYVDVVSAQGGKLAALEYVRALFGIATERCIASGDSGNDALMLGGANPAVVVGNAQDELLDWVMRQPQDGRLVVAEAEMAHGVLEGMARLGLY